MENIKYQRLNLSLAECSEAVENALVECFEGDEKLQDGLLCAEKYSLLGGGKRIRPFLVLELCRALGGGRDAALPLACAIEMIHTYSLIHDDLPCMDNDDMRRGKPSNHKAFGEANALLAGDALLTRAFLTVAKSPCLDDSQKSEAVKLLAAAAGDGGMIGGQFIDLESENKEISFDRLLELHSLKTGALIECAARLGALAAGFFGGSDEAERAARYASRIGLAFQVIDDVLDVTSSAQELGKPIGSDKESGKTTFLSFFEADAARNYAKELTEEAVSVLDRAVDVEILEELAYYLLERNS